MTIEVTEGPLSVAPAHSGRELILLLISAVGSSLALIVIDSTPLATEFGFPLIALPTLALIWAVVGIRFAVLFMRFALRRSWRPSFALSLLLAAAILLAVNFFPFIRECSYLGGALRFAANRSYYDSQVAHLPVDDKPRIGFFSWGGMIWASR